MEIRQLAEVDAEQWWRLRLESLKNDPFAFGKAVEEHQATTVEETALRFQNSTKDNFTLGAFAGDELIGMATFVRETGRKTKHKGNIYGVYVAQPHRGTGVGRALITSILSRVKEDPTVEQILISVSAGQEAAFALYCKCGFELFGTEPRALKIGSDYVDERQLVLFTSAAGWRKNS